MVTKMNIYELPTPLVLVDVEKVRKNIESVFERSKKTNKKIWPMVKTHKTTYIANIQREMGADGFTVGTIDEAEVLTEKGLTKTIMCGNVYISDRENLRRIVNIAERGVRVVLRIDNFEAAQFLNSELEKYKLKLDYTIKVDTGLHRFGVKPENVVKFARNLQKLKNLNFVGIVTHPGHAYASPNAETVEKVARETAELMLKVANDLKREGFEIEILGTGSTPTLRFDVENPVYTHLFPGNFVYYDRMQVEVFGSAKPNDCALTVLTTVISIPEHSDGKLAIINAGSKYFGLDRGAHGMEALRGFGRFIEHPKAVVIGLSEEVGEVDISEERDIRVGEKVRVIPNHACIVSNATSYIVLHDADKVRGLIEVDMRNGTRIPKVLSEVLLNKL